MIKRILSHLSVGFFLSFSLFNVELFAEQVIIENACAGPIFVTLYKEFHPSLPPVSTASDVEVGDFASDSSDDESDSASTSSEEEENKMSDLAPTSSEEEEDDDESDLAPAPLDDVELIKISGLSLVSESSINQIISPENAIYRALDFAGPYVLRISNNENGSIDDCFTVIHTAYDEILKISISDWEYKNGSGVKVDFDSSLDGYGSYTELLKSKKWGTRKFRTHFADAFNELARIYR